MTFTPIEALIAWVAVCLAALAFIEPKRKRGAKK